METPRQEGVGSASSGDITRGTTRDTGREDGGAPRYVIPPRELTAVEIPAVVEDIDRAVRAFGRAPSLRHVSLLLYLAFVSYISLLIGMDALLGPGSPQKLNTTVYQSRGAVLPAHHVA